MHLLGSIDVSTAGPSVAATPSDASFVGGQLWGLEKVKAGSRSENPAVNDVAWDFSTGSTRVTVADIDTGIDYTHPDLYRNVWLNQSEIPAAAKLAATDVDGDGLLTFWDLNDAANAGLVADVNANGRIDGGDVLSAWSDSVDEGSNGYTDDLIGWNFVTRNNNPYDDNGHGSHTAGTIGASANDGGVVGVNWKVQIMALKFLAADGSGSSPDAAAAIRYAVDNGAPVSNNSWGGGYSADIDQACSYANSKGHLIVAAAGNSGVNNDSSPFRGYPASLGYANIISVAATDINDARPSWSNYGKTTVDLGAPGVNIVSTVPIAKDTDGTPDGYASYSGTSMATPHVTGTVALVLARNGTLSASAVKSLILNNVDRVKSLDRKTVSGGRLNAFRTLGATPAAAAPATVQAATGAGTATTTFSAAAARPVAVGVAVIDAGVFADGRPSGDAAAADIVTDLLS